MVQDFVTVGCVVTRDITVASPQDSGYSGPTQQKNSHTSFPQLCLHIYKSRSRYVSCVYDDRKEKDTPIVFVQSMLIDSANIAKYSDQDGKLRVNFHFGVDSIAVTLGPQHTLDSALPSFIGTVPVVYSTAKANTTSSSSR